MAFDVRSSAPDEFGDVRLVSKAIVFGNTTVRLCDLEPGDVVLGAWCEVATAFNAGSTNVLTLGDGTTADKYLAAADITEGTPGVYPATHKGPFAAEAAAHVLTGTYTQTGTAATTGAGRFYALVGKKPL